MSTNTSTRTNKSVKRVNRSEGDFPELKAIKRPGRAHFAAFDDLLGVGLWVKDDKGRLTTIVIPAGALRRVGIVPSNLAANLTKKFGLSVITCTGNKDLAFLESKDEWSGWQAAAALTFSVFDRKSIHLFAEGGNA